MERTLLAQDAQRRGRVHRDRERHHHREAVPEPAQRDGVRGHADRPQAPRRGRLVRERVRGQRRHREVRRRQPPVHQGGDAQPAERHRTLRRGEHRPGRGDPRRARHRPGRSPGVQHRRVLLRPPGLRAGRPAARRAPPAAGDERGGGRGAGLRQPHGHPDGERGGAVRRPLPGQPPGVLRHRRADPGGDGVQGGAAGRPDRERGRADRAGRHPRRDVLFGRAAHRKRRR